MLYKLKEHLREFPSINYCCEGWLERESQQCFRKEVNIYRLYLNVCIITVDKIRLIWGGGGGEGKSEGGGGD